MVNFIEVKGLMTEPELIESMWPNGVQPSTLAPVARRSSNDDLITLHSETEGASIGFQLLNEDDTVGTTWQIYQNPLAVLEDQTLLVIAHRIGFTPSPTITVEN
jgi:hypothetical protein